MRLVLDTNFFVLHYFSKDGTLAKTRGVLNRCRKIGNSGVIPAIVLAEFYAIATMKAGREVAEKAYAEMMGSGLLLAEMTPAVARQAATLRVKYREEVPWGDCIIAATAILLGADYVVTEDPHFKAIGEVKARTLDTLRL